MIRAQVLESRRAPRILAAWIILGLLAWLLLQ